MFALSFYLQLIEDEESKDKLSWIYENFLNVMLYTAKKYVGQYQAEEDVVHDAVLKIIDNLEHVDISNPAKSKNYVCIIVKSCAIDWLRKRKNYSDTELDSVAKLKNSARMVGAENIIILQVNPIIRIKEAARFNEVTQKGVVYVSLQILSYFFRSIF